MEALKVFDGFVNNIVTPTSTYAGISAVFLSFFSNKLAPRMPPQFYKLLDNDLVRIIIVSFLLNQQLRKPSYSLIIASVMVFGYDLIVHFVAPDTPQLSEIVKSATEPEKKDPGSSGSGCNCYCGHTINVPTFPPPGSKMQELPEKKNMDTVQGVNEYNEKLNKQQVLPQNTLPLEGFNEHPVSHASSTMHAFHLGL
jgi:hypothetical protein